MKRHLTKSGFSVEEKQLSAIRKNDIFVFDIFVTPGNPNQNSHLSHCRSLEISFSIPNVHVWQNCLKSFSPWEFLLGASGHTV